MTDEELDRLAARWLNAIYEEDLAALVDEIRVLRHALQECADAYDIADVQEALSLAKKTIYGDHGRFDEDEACDEYLGLEVDP